MKRIIMLAAACISGLCSCSKNESEGTGLWNKANPLEVPYSATTINK